MRREVGWDFQESWERVPGSVSICFNDISFYLGPLISRVEDLYRWMHYHQVLVWHMFLDRRFRSERFLQTQVSSDARIASQKLHEVCTTRPYFSLRAQAVEVFRVTQPETRDVTWRRTPASWCYYEKYLPKWNFFEGGWSVFISLQSLSKLYCFSMFAWETQICLLRPALPHYISLHIMTIHIITLHYTRYILV